MRFIVAQFALGVCDGTQQLVCDEKRSSVEFQKGDARGIPRLENRETWGTRPFTAALKRCATQNHLQHKSDARRFR